MHFRKSQSFRDELVNNNEMSDFFISNENSPFLKLQQTEILSFSDNEKNILNSKLFNENDMNEKLLVLAENFNPEFLTQNPSLFADAESSILKKTEISSAHASLTVESAILKETFISNALPCHSSTLPCHSSTLPCHSSTLPCHSSTLPCNSSTLTFPPTELSETSIEYRMAVQERLNVRLQEQLYSWVRAQIELHQQLSEKESFNLINSKQKCIYENIFDGKAFPDIVKNDDKNVSKNPNNITDTIKNNNRKDGIELKIINEMTVINNNNRVYTQIYNNDNKNSEKENSNNMTGCINNDNDISYLSQNKNESDLELDSTCQSFYVPKKLFLGIIDKSKNITETKNILCFPSLDSSIDQNILSESTSVQYIEGGKEEFLR